MTIINRPTLEKMRLLFTNITLI